MSKKDKSQVDGQCMKFEEEFLSLKNSILDASYTIEKFSELAIIDMFITLRNSYNLKVKSSFHVKAEKLVQFWVHDETADF